MKRLLDDGANEGRVSLGTVTRVLPISVEGVTLTRNEDGEDENLELDLAFASETPVSRWFGSEELEVSSNAARLDRVSNGVVPLLSDHVWEQTVGRVLSVTIGSDRVARARVRFSRSAAARDVVQDVVDGIRQGVSFGYRVHEMILIETGDDGDRYRVTDWELFEVSIVSVPADPTVGIERGADEDGHETVIHRKVEPMKVRALHTPSGTIVEIDEDKLDGETYVRAVEATPAPPAPTPDSTPAPVVERSNEAPSRDQILADERKRVDEIETIGQEFSAPKETIRASVEAGHTPSEFLGVLRMEKAKEGKALTPPPTDLDLSRNERESFSILNAVRVVLDRRNGRVGESSLELECSDEIASRLDRSPQGFFVPYDVLSRSAWTGEIETRDIEVGGGGSGAALVGTDLMASGFIDLLRNRSVLGQLGATIIPGLVGNVDFPRQTTDPATGWVGETGGSGESTPVFDAVSMSPKTIRSRVDITRRMLLQSTPAVETLMRNSLGIALAKGIDLAGLAGSAAPNQPEGVLNMSGVGAGTWVGTNGTTQFRSVIQLETLVAVANADAGALGYVTTPEVRGQLKGTFKDSGAGQPIYTGSRNEGELNGYLATVTNSLPKNLGGGTDEHPIIAGYWPWLYIGEWGTLDLMPDNVTNADEAGLVLRAFQDVDVAAAHESAFATTSFVPTN